MNQELSLNKEGVFHCCDKNRSFRLNVKQWPGKTKPKWGRWNEEKIEGDKIR